jgi:hypothetical protein
MMADFVLKVVAITKCNSFEIQSIIQKLGRHFVGEDGTVTRAKSQKFFAYFEPIHEDQINYPESYKNNRLVNIHTISQISFLLNQPWFAGFLTSSESAIKLYKTVCFLGLAAKIQGDFLIRFSSSTPGAYALTVKERNGSVGDWKIFQKGNTYEIDGKSFLSFCRFLFCPLTITAELITHFETSLLANTDTYLKHMVCFNIFFNNLRMLKVQLN